MSTGTTMKIFARIAAAASLLALSACGSGVEETSNSAEDFAARINGGNATGAQATQAPQVAEPLPGAAPGPFTPGTQTDPSSACGATKMGPFIGKVADDPTRVQIMAAAEGILEVRFIAAGSPYINPDPTNPRLNLMLDQQNVIRDARCG